MTLGRQVYLFGEFTLDVTERRLSRGDAPLHLAPKAFDLLVALVRSAGRLVTKAELLARVWPEAFVEEGILAVHVSSVRKVLGAENADSTYIETVPRSGYRFIAAVRASAGDEDREANRHPSRPLEALELVGRGRGHLLAASVFELPDAVSAFQRAIAIDPTYAAAHAGLALARISQAALRATPHVEAYADAKAAALSALAMEEACADAQAALGQVLFLSEWDWRGAERAFQRALDINPHHTEALLHYGGLLEALGRLDRGLQLKQQALERDPSLPFALVAIAVSFWNQRRYDDALAWAHKALKRDPRNPFARELAGGVYFKTRQIDRMVAEDLKRAEAFGVPAEALAAARRAGAELKGVYETRGHQAAMQHLIDHRSREAPTIGLVLPVLHAEAGNLDTAFELVDHALDTHDPALVHLAVAPQWDALRADERFEQRLKRMGVSGTTHAATTGPSKRPRSEPPAAS